MKKIIRTALIVLSIGILTFGSIPFATPTTANAADPVKCDQNFYSDNDILFYNPCATSCSDASNGPVADITALRGGNNGEKIFNFWVDAGLTSQEAAGITGSLKNESGYSAFRQETTIAWDGGGWGIAQFTGGQRVGTVAQPGATDFVKNAVGADLFSQYYKNDYGGAVTEASGFIPAGVSTDVNDKFLLAELNYLLGYIQTFQPSSISQRVDQYKTDFNQTVPAGTTLYDYLKTVVRAEDAATAWTYLYEFPGEIKDAANKRAHDAADIMTLYSTGVTADCGGGLAAGGMTLEQGITFMNNYKNDASNVQYIAGAGTDCVGGPLSNCVSFSVFFVRKYTNLKEAGAAGNGSTVVSHLISLNPTVANGHSPRPYAIFSTPSGSQMCGDIKCGHTGVILGVDTAAGTVVVGEASCGSAASWDTARTYPLAQFDSDAYTYIYTDGLLKGDVK